MEVIDYLTKNKIREENFRKYLETQEQFALDRHENIDYTATLNKIMPKVIYGDIIL